MLKVYSHRTPHCTALIDFKYLYRSFTNSDINTITIILTHLSYLNFKIDHTSIQYRSRPIPMLTCACLKVWFGLWCLTPLSTIFQLYRGSQIYWWMKSEYPKKATELSQVCVCFNQTLHLHRADVLYKVTLHQKRIQYNYFVGKCTIYTYQIRNSELLTIFLTCFAASANTFTFTGNQRTLWF